MWETATRSGWMVEERQRDGHDPTEKLKQRKLRQRRRE
jgi:hypothetical protein